MDLNTIASDSGSRKVKQRVGRGIGSGRGKTCGRGHKGQKARSGGFHKVGFEGGQMPMQRRVPKFGFASRKGKYVDEIRLHELNLLPEGTVTLDVLRKAGLITSAIKRVKIMMSGKLENKVHIAGPGIKVTAGAREVIEKAGGKVEE